MDPLTALGLAGNILAFVDFTAKILKRAIEIYDSADGHSQEFGGASIQNHLHAILITTSQVAATEAKTQPGTTSSTIPAGAPRKAKRGPKSSAQIFEVNTAALDETVRSLIVHATVIGQSVAMADQAPATPVSQVATSCQKLAQRLIDRLESRKTAKGQVWNSLKRAVQDVWPHSDVKTMLSDLDKLQGQLVFHVVASIKDSLGPMQRSLDLLNKRQLDQFDKLSSVQDRLEELMRVHMTSLGSVVTKLSQEAAANSPELHTLVSREHEKTRDHTIRVINDALGFHELKTPFGLEEAFRLWGTGTTYLKPGAEQLSIKLLEDEKLLVRSLNFQVMDKRSGEIAEAELSTFDWIFEDPRPGTPQWDGFSNWLVRGDALYWITGKAGSGKSTLMKHLVNHPITQEKLLQWAGSREKLVVASFYFWNTGTDMQKTQEGLLRSLLYQVLYRHRELICELLPEIRRPSNEIDTENWIPEWNYRHLLSVFQCLIRQTAVPLKICFFIDGLDEYDGEDARGKDAKIGNFVKELAKSNDVKVCVSSRPHLDFRHIFESSPSLILSNLTSKDIRTYVARRFKADTMVALLQCKDPELIDYLSQEIVEKAQGVFLWVKFVVGDLLRGLGNADRRKDLEWRLNQLPRNLENLYLHILRKIEPPRYREQSAKLLQIVLHAHKPLTLLQFAFADEVMDFQHPDFIMNAVTATFSKDKQEEICMDMEKRLVSRCLGLIEVDTAVSDTFISNTTRQVRFHHQSVVDFVNTKEARGFMEDNLHGQDFRPYPVLMSANILVLKHLTTDFFPVREPATYLAEAWYCDSWTNIRNFMSYAKAAELGERVSQNPLVDRMDDIATSLANELLQIKGSRGSHWSQRRQRASSVESDASMISFALECGLYHYAERHFKDGGTITRAQAEYALLKEQAAFERGSTTGRPQIPTRNFVLGELRNAAHSRMKIWHFSLVKLKRKTAARLLKDDMIDIMAGQHLGTSEGFGEHQIISQSAFPDIGGTINGTH